MLWKKNALPSFLLTLGVLITQAALADMSSPILDQISYQINQEQWVTTKTAKVSVSVNASLNAFQLGEVQAQILQKLAKLAPGADWHLTSFNRSQDSSGLEQIQAQAQARLPQENLANLRQQAVAITKPGETYKIVNIDFSPTLVEVEAVKTLLRDKIYNEVKAETVRLNQIYPTQSYFVHNINFSWSSPSLPPPPEQPTAMVYAKTAVANPGPTLAVSNKLNLSVDVVLGSVQAQINMPKA